MKRLSVALVALLAIPALAFAAASRQETETRSSPTETKAAPVQLPNQGEAADQGLICAPPPARPVPVCSQATCSACPTVGDCNSKPGCVWTGTACI